MADCKNCGMSDAETPEQVYNETKGNPEPEPEYFYRVTYGKVARVKIIKKPKTSLYYRVCDKEFEGNIIPRDNRWARCPIEACELWVKEICKWISEPNTNMSKLINELKKAIHLLETFDAEKNEWAPYFNQYDASQLD